MRLNTSSQVATWIKLIWLALTGHTTTGWTTVVQLVRNFLCCIKDLSLEKNTFFSNPFLLDAPPPLHKTTWLEFVISLTQFYACVSVTRSGVLMLNSSLGKLVRVARLRHLQSNNAGTRATRTSDKLAAATSIVSQHLATEQSSARNNVVVAMCLLTIGIAFFWLFAHSWHVSERDWIGGVAGLMRALTMMEIALFILLYFMLDGARDIVAKSTRMQAFVSASKEEMLHANMVDAESYAWMVESGWKPFWTANVSFLSNARKDRTELQMLNDEIAKVSQEVASFLSSGGEELEETKAQGARSRSRSRDAKKRGTGRGDANASARVAVAAERLESEIPTARMEGYREYLYFALNFAAFYGYMLCVVAYHWSSVQEPPAYIRALKLGMSNEGADWYGNFVGDLMWTIEPTVALVSPVVMEALKPKPLSAKPKTD